MLATGVGSTADDDGYVRFAQAGAKAHGEYHCADCGYGVIVHTTLPPCPMCSGRAWEQSVWNARRGRSRSAL